MNTKRKWPVPQPECSEATVYYWVGVCDKKTKQNNCILIYMSSFTEKQTNSESLIISRLGHHAYWIYFICTYMYLLLCTTSGVPTLLTHMQYRPLLVLMNNKLYVSTLQWILLQKFLYNMKMELFCQALKTLCLTVSHVSRIQEQTVCFTQSLQWYIAQGE